MEMSNLVSNAVELEWLTAEEISPFYWKAKTYGDDSSDEEGEQENRNEGIEKGLEALETDENVLSHTALAIAIKLMYSQRVQKAYRAKKRHLKDSFEVPNVKDLNQAVMLVAEHIATNQRQLDSVKSQVDTYTITADILKAIRVDFTGFFKSLYSQESINKFFEVFTCKEGDFAHSERISRVIKLLQINLDKFTLDKYFFEMAIVDFLSDNFWVDLLSSLRLHNRIALRMAKHGYKKEHQKTWIYKFGPHEKEFKLEVNVNNGRHDYLPGIGSYPKFVGMISKEVLDRFPSVVSAEGQLVPANALILHFLLFGVEVMRSPSAIIHHMMFSDLVKAGKRSWEEAFRDRKLPMSMEGAVEASRQKHSMYNKLMKQKYTYDRKKGGLGDTDKTTLHLTLERKIMQDWLNMKLEEKQPNDTNATQVLSVSSFTLINEACKIWYGIGVDVEKHSF